MTDITEYRERRFGARRDFRLLDDVVSIHGKTVLLSDFDSSVPLRALIPVPSRIRIRTPTPFAGLVLFLYAVILISIFWNGPGPKQNLILFVLGCLLTLGGLAIGLAAFRKIEFFQFHNEAGVTILDIARAGPDANNLDAFLNAMINRVHQLRMSPNPTVDPDARKSP